MSLFVPLYTDNVKCAKNDPLCKIKIAFVVASFAIVVPHFIQSQICPSMPTIEETLAKLLFNEINLEEHYKYIGQLTAQINDTTHQEVEEKDNRKLQIKTISDDNKD